MRRLSEAQRSEIWDRFEGVSRCGRSAAGSSTVNDSDSCRVGGFPETGAGWEVVFVSTVVNRTGGNQ